MLGVLAMLPALTASQDTSPPRAPSPPLAQSVTGPTWTLPATMAATQLRAADAANTLVGSKIALDYAAKVDAPTPQQVLKRAVGIFLITGGNKLGSDLSNPPPALKPYLGEISQNLDELNNVDPSLMSSGFNSYVSIPFNVVKGFWLTLSARSSSTRTPATPVQSNYLRSP